MRWFWLLLVAGCTSRTPSSELSAAFDVTYESDGSLFVAMRIWDYNTEPQQSYVLTGDESVRASFRDQDIPLVASFDPLLGPGYYASVAVDPAPLYNEWITGIFDRGGGEVVQFVPSAPDDFMPSAPASTAQPVSVTWTPIASDPMRWTAQVGDWMIDGPIPQDEGHIDFPAGVLANAMPTTPTPVTIAITRFRGRDFDSTLLGASAEFARTRDVTVQVTP